MTDQGNRFFCFVQQMTRYASGPREEIMDVLQEMEALNEAMENGLHYTVISEMVATIQEALTILDDNYQRKNK